MILQCFAVLALLGSVAPGPAAPASNLEGSAWGTRWGNRWVSQAAVVQAPVVQAPVVQEAVVQEADQAQESDDEEDTPPLDGAAGQVIFYAFLIVMLVVPWLMARSASDGGSRPAERDTATARPGSRFTSDRERRLWLWTLAVLIAIYSTLGPMAELAAALRERNLLRVSSTAVLLLVVAFFAVPWVKNRPGRFEIGAAIGVTTVYLATLIRMPVPEARSHMFEYGLLAILIYQALTERRQNGREIPVPAVIAVVATTLLGWLDEGIQAFLPNRVYDLLDVGFDAAAALTAIVATLFMSWARRLDLFKRNRA